MFISKYRKFRGYKYGKLILMYITILIGLIIFLGGCIYLLRTSGIKLINEPYAISIPRRFYGEVVLAPSSGYNVQLKTLAELKDVNIRGGILSDVVALNINDAYSIITLRVHGYTVENSQISIAFYLYDNNGSLIGAIGVTNNSNIINGEYILSFGLSNGHYVLKTLSNSNIILNYLSLRGVYYNQTTQGISIRFTPEEFNHYTIYYVKGIDVTDLWISISMMLIGLVVIVIALLLYVTVVHPLLTSKVIGLKKS